VGPEHRRAFLFISGYALCLLSTNTVIAHDGRYGYFSFAFVCRVCSVCVAAASGNSGTAQYGAPAPHTKYCDFMRRNSRYSICLVAI
jgi:hypothetical protein